MISSGSIPSLHIGSKCSRAYLLCPCMANPPRRESKRSHHARVFYLLNTLQASSMLSHFAYMSTRLFLNSRCDLQPLWMTSLWMQLFYSIASTQAQALSTPTKVTGSGCTPSHCIGWNNSNASCHCPCSYIRAVQRHHIMQGHLVEHCQSILHSPQWFQLLNIKTFRPVIPPVQRIWVELCVAKFMPDHDNNQESSRNSRFIWYLNLEI